MVGPFFVAFHLRHFSEPIVPPHLELVFILGFFVLQVLLLIFLRIRYWLRFQLLLALPSMIGLFLKYYIISI